MPHEELPQLTFHVTPAFLLSLLTVAIMPVLVLTFSEEGGGLRNDTEIGTGGAGPLLEPLLHATSQTVIARQLRVGSRYGISLDSSILIVQRRLRVSSLTRSRANKRAIVIANGDLFSIQNKLANEQILLVMNGLDLTHYLDLLASD